MVISQKLIDFFHFKVVAMVRGGSLLSFAFFDNVEPGKYSIAMHTDYINQ